MTVRCNGFESRFNVNQLQATVAGAVICIERGTELWRDGRSAELRLGWDEEEEEEEGIVGMGG